jgi:hypothetical protein
MGEKDEKDDGKGIWVNPDGTPGGGTSGGQGGSGGK